MQAPLNGSPAAEGAVEPMLASLRHVSPDVLLLQVVVPPGGEAAAHIFVDLPAEIEQARQSLERIERALASSPHLEPGSIAG